MNSFFDDMLGTARDIAHSATKKTGEIVELSKNKLDCIKINNEIEELYEQLGKAVYSMVKGGYENNDLIEGLTEEIDALMLRLDAVNEKIGEMKNISYCQSCGAKNPGENYYCSHCGTKLKSEFDNSFDNEDADDEI